MPNPCLQGQSGNRMTENKPVKKRIASPVITLPVAKTQALYYNVLLKLIVEALSVNK